MGRDGLVDRAFQRVSHHHAQRIHAIGAVQADLHRTRGELFNHYASVIVLCVHECAFACSSPLKSGCAIAISRASER